MTFGCHVTGDPEPQVSWLYDDRPINHTWLTIEAEEGLLDKWANISVYNVSDADAGVYTCVATNSLSTVSSNVTLVLPEVVTATTLSKSEVDTLRWMGLVAGAVVACMLSCAAMVALCMKSKSRRRRSNLKASVSFTDQEKKLLDVSIATTTDRGTGSCEAFGTEMELVDPPVHITIENEPLPMVSISPIHFRTNNNLLPPLVNNSSLWELYRLFEIFASNRSRLLYQKHVKVVFPIQMSKMASMFNGKHG